MTDDNGKKQVGPSASSILPVFKDENYRMAHCHVMPYDRRRRQVFGDNYLYYLWNECAKSGRPQGSTAILDTTFCGMTDRSADAICAYLHTRIPLLLLCVDKPANPSVFDVAGFAFPTVMCGNAQTERAAIAGYCFFRQWWGTEECQVLGMLGLAYLFQEMNLQAIHGQRYATNVLTARYMAQFGSRDVGVIPRFIVNDGKLEDCVISTLLREDFESYVRRKLLTMASGEPVESHGQRRRQHRPDGPGSSAGNAEQPDRAS